MTSNLAKLSVESFGDPAEHDNWMMSSQSLPSTSKLSYDSDCTVGIVYDKRMELHRLPRGHPERPERTSLFYTALELHGLQQRCKALPARKATQDELLRAHTEAHIHDVETKYTTQVRKELIEAYEDKDVYYNADTSVAAWLAAGCCVQAVDQVLKGTTQRALALVRPPGHHAECQRAMGFCFFNNVAVAALAALQHPGTSRVVILDWDIHHGNGIQDILISNPHVLYISIHRGDRGFYPGTGRHSEAGEGPGLGFNINIPWSRKGAGDVDYMAAFELLVQPVVRSFSPDLVLVSAGFDAVEGDPLGGCHVSPEGYAHMTHRLLEFAGGRVVLALEGGYNVRQVAECGCACMRVLLGDPLPAWDDPEAWTPQENTQDDLRRVYEVHAAYWPALARVPFDTRWQAFVSRQGEATPPSIDPSPVATRSSSASVSMMSASTAVTARSTRPVDSSFPQPTPSTPPRLPPSPAISSRAVQQVMPSRVLRQEHTWSLKPFWK